MKYVSTRGKDVSGITASAAIKKGLADDGGLYMPNEIPTLSGEDIERLCKMSYPERAADILFRFLNDYDYDEIYSDCLAAYSEKSFPGGAAPIHPLGDSVRVLELWHGPTCAFKDMALQIMPRLLSRALVKNGEKRTAYILVATSGDTGKAALEGYRDVEGVKIKVYYPQNGVSKIQKLQMATQEGKNVSVVAVNGNFDDAQNGVKKIFSDKDVAAKMNAAGYFFSSANSINWGRLAPQIAYYVSAYCDLVSSGEIENGQSVNICVPTGNFGNIFAAFIAKEMGLPVNRFICASNRNNILTDFLKSGTYDRRRDFHMTMSPSMDILISSNLERLLYLVGAASRTADYMKSLSEKGVYSVDGDIKSTLDSLFCGYFCGEEETAETISGTFKKHGYLCDTHTAVALFCADKYINETGDKRKMIVASTASPYKFASNVCRSLGGGTFDDEFDALTALFEISGAEIPAPLASLKEKTVRFDKTIPADGMVDELYSELSITSV